MAAKIKIDVDNKQAVQNVNEVISKIDEAQKAAGKPLKVGNQGVDKIKQAEKALNKLKGTATTGIGKQLGSAFAGIGKALLSPIGAAIVSFEILFKICKAYYNQIREGQNQKLNSQNRLNILKQESKQLEEEKKKTEDIAKVLQELNSQEKLTNIEREFAVSLVNQLNEGYEGMNLQIDKSTGKIKNLNQEMAKLRQLQKQQQIGNINQQMDSLSNAIDAQLNEIFTDFVQGFKSLKSDNFAYNLPTKTDRMKANLSDMFGGIGQVRQIYSHLAQFQEELNAAGEDYVKRMEIVEKKIFPLIQDTEDKTKLASLIGSSDWKDMKELAKRLNELKNIQTDVNKATQDYVAAQVKAKAATKNQKDAIKQLEQWKKKTQRDRQFNASPAQKQVEMLRDQITEADTKLAELQNKLKKQGENYLELPSYQAQIEDLQKKIREAVSPEYKQMLQNQLVDMINKQKDAQGALNDSLEKQHKIEEEINKNTQQRVKKVNELTDLQKKYGETTKSFFGSQLKSIESKLYEQVGKATEYQLKQMKEKFRQQFKRDATFEEQGVMKDLIKANAELNRMQKVNPIPIEGTITNELAKKGGFASSVVVEDANSLNKRLLEANEKQVSINEKMLGKVDKLDSTIKQLGILR